MIRLLRRFLGICLVVLLFPFWVAALNFSEAITDTCLPYGDGWAFPIFAIFSALGFPGLIALGNLFPTF